MENPRNREHIAILTRVARFVRRIGRGIWIGLLASTGTVVLAVVLFAIYLPLAFLGIAPIPGACVTNVKKITDLPGYDFEIRDTNCDVIAKEAWVSVSIAARGSGQEKEILFQYDPAGYDPTSLPTVEMPTPDIVLLSVPIVSSVSLQVETWRNLSIEYRIGKVIAPWGNEKTQPVHARQGPPSATP